MEAEQRIVIGADSLWQRPAGNGLIEHAANPRPIDVFASNAKPNESAGATVSGALEGFVRAAAVELPKGLRINVVNPTILKESEGHMGSFFPGVIPVEGWRVAQAYKRAILGVQTGRVYKVD